MGKIIGGLLLFFIGISLGAYVGLWWATVGGINLIVEGIQTANYAWAVVGVVRILFAGAAGYLSAMACIIPSMIIMAVGVEDLSQR